jgi:hypothetical protein
MFERVRARKTEKGVAVFMRAYGTCSWPHEQLTSSPCMITINCAQASWSIITMHVYFMYVGMVGREKKGITKFTNAGEVVVTEISVML